MLSGLAQAAAFGKSVLIAYYFGIGTELDGYYLAQAIPTVVAGVVAGFLQSSLLTAYAGNLARGELDAASALLARMLASLAILAAASSVALSWLAPAVVSWIAPEATDAVRDAAVTSLRVLAFLLLLNALVDSLSLALNAHGAFAAAALAPTINAVVASVLLLAFPDWGLSILIWGTLIGLGAQLALVVLAFRRHRIRLAWKAAADLKPAFRAGAAIVPGLIFANLSGLVPQIVAARLGDGAVATLSVAMRLHGAVTQVLAVALSTVLLPHFAHAVARGDYSSITAQLHRGFPIVALLALAALLWVGLVGEPFITFVFERGAFDRNASVAVAATWFWLTVGLLPAVWGLILAKVLQAMQLGAMISAIAAMGFALTLGLCVLLAWASGLTGVALASGLGVLGTTLACTWAVAKRLGMSALRPARPAGTLAAWLAVTVVAAAAPMLVDAALRPFARSVAPAGVTALIFAATAVGLRLLLRPGRTL